MKYLVKFKKCEQISPDDFEVQFKEKLFDDTATIADIKDWVFETVGNRYDKKPFRLFEVQLSQPEQ